VTPIYHITLSPNRDCQDVLKNKDAVFLLKYWIAACGEEQPDDVVTGL